MPFLSIIKPDPSAADFLFWGVPNSLNMSSNGDPGGNWNPGNGFELVRTVVVVAILTTDGINLSARSAKEDGNSFANVWGAKPIKNIAMTNLLNIFILIFNIPNNCKSYNCKY